MICCICGSRPVSKYHLKINHTRDELVEYIFGDMEFRQGMMNKK